MIQIIVLSYMSILTIVRSHKESRIASQSKKFIPSLEVPEQEPSIIFYISELFEFKHSNHFFHCYWYIVSQFKVVTGDLGYLSYMNVFCLS